MTCRPPRRLSTDRPDCLDLNERWVDVHRLTKAHPSFRRCLASGWDADDLTSEVMVRILARQSMASRYDPKRAAVGTYLHLAVGSIMSDLIGCERFLGSKREELLAEGRDIEDTGDPDTDEGTMGQDPWLTARR